VGLFWDKHTHWFITGNDNNKNNNKIIKYEIQLIESAVPVVVSACGWLAVTDWDPKSASKSTAGALFVIGGDRGEGNVIGCTADFAGRPEEDISECIDVGRCNGCIWLAGAADVAGWKITIV